MGWRVENDKVACLSKRCTLRLVDAAWWFSQGWVRPPPFQGDENLVLDPRLDSEDFFQISIKYAVAGRPTATTLEVNATISYAMCAPSYHCT